MKPDIILTEDSNSGNQFFKAASERENLECRSAGGKSNLFAEAMQICHDHPDVTILVIADGAAFGAEMEKMIRLMEEQKQLVLYLPESFEWLILKSGVIEDFEVIEILLTPGDYIDSQKYFSWERFFTALLVSRTENTYLKYTKRSLNHAYLGEKVKSRILDVMGKIMI